MTIPISIVRFAVFTLVALVLTATGVKADVPKISTTTLPTPLPLPYDESVDAHAQVAAAIADAQTTHKYVLLDFGGNWCADCRVLMGALELPEVRSDIQKTFEIVPIDVGRLRKNLDIAKQYGVVIKAVPTVIVLDSEGHMINSGNPAALADARLMTPQSIVDTVYGWIGQHR